METSIKRWGNSAAVRIPVLALRAAKLAVNDAISLRVEGGKIVIEAASPLLVSIENLVAGIDSTNIHEGIEMGPPVGKEFW